MKATDLIVPVAVLGGGYVLYNKVKSPIGNVAQTVTETVEKVVEVVKEAPAQIVETVKAPSKVAGVFATVGTEVVKDKVLEPVMDARKDTKNVLQIAGAGITNAIDNNQAVQSVIRSVSRLKFW